MKTEIREYKGRVYLYFVGSHLTNKYLVYGLSSGEPYVKDSYVGVCYLKDEKGLKEEALRLHKEIKARG